MPKKHCEDCAYFSRKSEKVGSCCYELPSYSRINDEFSATQYINATTFAERPACHLFKEDER